MSKHSEEFTKFINYLKENEISDVNICMHSSPDPDAVGSALGVEFLLRPHGIKSRILYNGEISHPQNKTIVNVLNITLEKISVEETGVNICVDCTPENSCAKDAKLVIDHHKVTSKSDFQIIQPTYGACSSIVWKLIKELDVETPPDDVNIYTALLLGIRTDTNDLISDYMSKDDFIAYQELLDISDKESLQKVMNYPYPRYLYEKRLELHKEGNNYESNAVFVGGVGFLPASQRDSIAILAEEYARMESVQTAVIFAITDKKFLEVSVRSSNISLDVKQLCKDLFGEYGGGSSFKGGAKIPLNFYSKIDDSAMEELWQVTCKQMFKKVHKEGWVEEVNAQT
jgi:nanoRNase/pAp phosphatase (c-di-AMP/oligoRNAs hydrolase)